ncbi:MAG: lytic transglycosylase domain-containing protein [Candidatus Rokuibacteriota bacterium]
MIDAHKARRRHRLTLVLAGVGLALSAESVPGSWGPEFRADEQRREAILSYMLVSNPQAPVHALRTYPQTLLSVSRELGFDHCFALAQVEVESRFSPQAVGSAGEIGLFQILPSTARAFGHRRQDLFDPHVNTRVALRYLSDIVARRPVLREALAEYNGGPANRSPYYALTVLENYARVLRHTDLRCEPERNPDFSLPRRRHGPRLATLAS